jgi:hypothetical protein
MLLDFDLVDADGLPAMLTQNLLRLVFLIRRPDTDPEHDPVRRHERLQRSGLRRPQNADCQ